MTKLVACALPLAFLCGCSSSSSSGGSPGDSGAQTDGASNASSEGSDGSSSQMGTEDGGNLATGFENCGNNVPTAIPTITVSGDTFTLSGLEFGPILGWSCPGQTFSFVLDPNSSGVVNGVSSESFDAYPVDGGVNDSGTYGGPCTNPQGTLPFDAATASIYSGGGGYGAAVYTPGDGTLIFSLAAVFYTSDGGSIPISSGGLFLGYGESCDFGFTGLTPSP
jgi:hypothetical protein